MHSHALILSETASFRFHLSFANSLAPRLPVFFLMPTHLCFAAYASNACFFAMCISTGHLCRFLCIVCMFPKRM